MKQTHVLVLCGGKSTEREVSLRSGKAVAEALKQAGFAVTVMDPAQVPLSEIERIAPDCAFIALHGIGGEDGAIQGVLEWMDIPYTGPDIAASALCLDKLMTKKILTASGISTPEFLSISRNADRKESAKIAQEKLGLPLVLKASRQGSSIGTMILHRAEELEAALTELSTYGDDILAEKYLTGTELTVPIFGNGDLTILPVIEIVSEGQFYDFESKYTPGKSHHILPARILPQQETQAKDLARAAYLATGCLGLARVDLMADDKGDLYVIEINTSPGMTETSLFPDAAAFAGISFPDLVSRLVRLALDAHSAKHRQP